MLARSSIFVKHINFSEMTACPFIDYINQALESDGEELVHVYYVLCLRISPVKKESTAAERGITLQH